MARTIAELPKGTRISNCISLGVLATTFPLPRVEGVLASQQKASRRQRDLPAHVVVYYVMALALFMQVCSREVLRCLLEVWAWLLGPNQAVRITGKSGISQARNRLGGAVLQQLYDELVKPLAVKNTRGGLVPALASGELGRQHAGGGRRERKRGSLRSSRGESWRQRPSADPLRGAGGERNARAVWRPSGRLRDR
jgi:hypothetical protein